MKRAKKCIIVAGAFVILAAMPITAYAFSFGWKSAKTEIPDTEEASYVFEAGETEISMGAEAAPVVEALGKPEKTFEQDSCAYQGKDTVYTYQGFELSTYPVEGTDHIASVYFLDDTVSTPEGIRIGSKKQDIINSYGSDYAEEFGVYRYQAGDTELVIYTTGGIVDAVEYLVLTE